MEGLDAVGLFQKTLNRDRQAIVCTVRHKTGRSAAAFATAPACARTKSLLARQKSQATNRQKFKMMAERDENLSKRG